jgi:nanoRNase/pAp phosphatase (c-di-AMP/oligoRNAs hydrolase)
MGETTQTFKSTIENANKILLILPHIINTDVCASAGLVYKLLKEKMQKDVDMAAPRAVPARFHEILRSCGVDTSKIFTEIKPVSYVIRVNETNDRVDVAWQKQNDKIEVVLTPEKQEIDFNKISFSKEGGIYDAVITFNAQSLEDLGRIYTDFDKLYSRFELISFNNQAPDAPFAKISVHEDNASTTSEVVYNLYDDLGFSMDKGEAEIVADGIIGSTYGLHQVSKNKTFRVISELANKFQVDINAITTKYFYAMSKDSLKLRERLLRNVSYDDQRKTIYSILTARDFSETRVNPQDLDGVDYLPFNICKDYDIAFLVYEDGTKSHVLIHSNRKNKDLAAILKKLNGVGTRMYGMATFTEDAATAVRTTLHAIWAGEPSIAQTNAMPPAAPEPVKADVTAIEPEVSGLAPVQAPQQPSVVSQVPAQPTVEPTAPAAPEVQVPAASPFTQASAFQVDEKAEPLKVSGSYSSTNTPFDQSK